MTDPYKILGVSPNAGEDEVKMAYRSMAKMYHPDKNPGDDGVKAKFQEVQQAYDAIVNGKARRGKVYGGARSDPNFDYIRDVFRTRYANTAGREYTTKHLNIKQNVFVNFEDVYNGAKKTFTLHVKHKCDTCGGFPPLFRNEDECPGCNNRGYHVEERNIKVKMDVLAHHYSNMEVYDDKLSFVIRLKNMGRTETVKNDIVGELKLTGDAYLVVKCKVPDHLLISENGNVVHMVECSLSDVLLKDSIELETFYGRRFKVKTGQFKYISDISIKIPDAGMMGPTRPMPYVFRLKVRRPDLPPPQIEGMSDILDGK